jgi:hypothetical protein
MSTKTGTADGKFKKIRVWAEAEGYKVKNWEGYQSITIFTEVGNFEVSHRESTIYHSIRGMRGNPKGLYVGFPGVGSLNYANQTDALRNIKDHINALSKKGGRKPW